MAFGASATSYRRAMMFANDPGAALVQFIFAVMDAFGLTMLVFLRKGFGERFYTLFMFGTGLGILSFLMALRSLAGALMGALPMIMSLFGVPPLIGMLAGPLLMHPHHNAPRALFDAASLLYWGFFIVGGAHLIAVWMRSWNIGNRIPVHSKSTGEPLLTFGGRVNYWLTTIVLEPLAVVLIGKCLHGCDASVPMGYFEVLAFFIGASALHQYRLAKNDYLDDQDARILAGFYADQAREVAKAGKPAWKIGGVFFPLMLPKKRETQVSMLREWARRQHEAVAESALTAPEEVPTPQQAA